MSLPASDNFNRADETPIGGNWTAAPGSNGSAVNLAGNCCVGTGSWSVIYWNLDAFNADQYSQCDSKSYWYANGPMVRIYTGSPGAGVQGYVAQVSTADQKTINLKAFTNSGDVLIGSYTPGSLALTDVVKLQVVGTTLTVFINGVQVMQCTDSTFSSGQAGLQAGSYGNSDDWAGGNVSGGQIPFNPWPQEGPILAQ